jgi:hypothetical protein
MKVRKRLVLTPMKVAVLIVISVIFIIIITITVIKLQSKREIEKTYLNISWAYSYADMKDLTNHSDIIALIKVQSIPDSESQDGKPFTIFRVQVEKAIYGCEDNEYLKIYMTGHAGKNKIEEVMDDPLMNKGDEFLIFAKKNSNETCTVLSGPQGRLLYKDGKVSSLNYVYKNVKKIYDFLPIDAKQEDFKNMVDKIEVLTSEKKAANAGVLKDFTVENIKSIEMSCQPDIKITFSEQQMEEFLTLLGKVNILNKSSYQVLCGQMIRFTFTMKDNSTNIVDIINPYVIINNNWYESDYEPSEQINQFANNRIKEYKK